MAKNNDTSPSRRGLLKSAPAATVAVVLGGAAATPQAPPVASPEITAAIADYWTHLADANAPGAGDEMVDLKSDEMDVAAARIAALPGRNLADLAAKIVFFVEVMNHQNAWGHVTDAEGDVLASVETDVLAMLGVVPAHATGS